MLAELQYIVMLAAFGAVSGLEILDRRECVGLNMSDLSRWLGYIFGIVDIGLYGVTFFVFPLPTAIVVVLASALLCAVASKLPPPATRVWFSYGWTIAGLAAGFAFLAVR